MSAIENLRKSLALSSEGLSPEDKKKMAVAAITTILDALGRGVGPFGEWEQRCLAASIIALRASKYDDSRALARRAIWPEENRRNSGVARLLLRPGMLTLDELARELKIAQAMQPRRFKDAA
jgi:hypothetical protein